MPTAFDTEAALVRPQITCGTHALAVALCGQSAARRRASCLRWADPTTRWRRSSASGRSPCSLKEYGVTYRQVDLLPDGSFDYDGIRAAINEKTKLVTIQRSKGYATRPTFSVEQIGELIAFCKKCIRSDMLCMVDNCYGEFVETQEPTDVGADMVVGIPHQKPRRRPGSHRRLYLRHEGPASSRCAYRLTAPGLGQEVGANLGLMPSLYQGLFLAPYGGVRRRKGRDLCRQAAMRQLGFRCRARRSGEPPRTSFRRWSWAAEEAMVAFCQGIQAAAPVDSFAHPRCPGICPGYDGQVIMAAGAFVQGSSIELSADGPIRPPYAVYFQGGLTWNHAKLGILMSLQKLCDAGLVQL